MATARESAKKIIQENISGRKLVFVESFVKLEEYLTENEVHIDVHVTLDKSKIDNNKFYDISILNGMKSEYYVFVPFQIDNVLKELLIAYGYTPTIDFSSMEIMHKRVRGPLKDYCDGFNNRCNFIPENVTLVFAGTNCNIYFPENVTINGWAEMTVYDDVYFIIGEYSIIGGTVILGSNTNVNIGEYTSCKFQTVRTTGDCSINIGNQTTFTSAVTLIVINGSVEIGTDCMIAAYNLFYIGDGHGVFDVNTMKHINGSHEKNQIILKDHVWVGTKSILLSKTIIESGSIVGAGSVVKGHFPNNCVIAGNTATVKKKDTAWCRDQKGVIKDEEREYFRKTVTLEERKENENSSSNTDQDE